MSEEELRKKRKKIKHLRAQLDSERAEWQAQLRHRENTIQELLTLRMFLRASIEWIKESVAESFPRYNSLLYTATLSNFGLLVTNGFIDLVQETREDSGESARAFWAPYIVWAFMGLLGWCLDYVASRKNSVARKLANVQAATFGAISASNMRHALEGSTSELDKMLNGSVDFETVHKLGQEGI